MTGRTCNSWTAPGLLIDTPGLRLVAPVQDEDEPIPLVDNAALNRERRARERELHRTITKELRSRGKPRY
jgi:hypothetical protein